MQEAISAARSAVMRGGPWVGWGAVGVIAFLLGYLLETFSLRTAVIALFGALGLVIVSLPYRWSIAVFFVFIGFEGLAKMLSGYNPVVHVGADLLIGALTARWFLSLLLRRVSLPSRFPPLTYLIAAHFVWFSIQIANPYAISLEASLAGMKLYVTMVLLYFYGYYLATSAKQIRLFMMIWVALSVLQVVTSLYQAAMGPQSVTSLSPYYEIALKKFEGYAFRPFGTTAVPGAPSNFVFLTAPFAFYFFVRGSSKIMRLGLLALLPASVLTLLVCQVRSALMKGIVGSTLFLLASLGRTDFRTRVRAIALVGAGVALIIFTLPHLTSRWVETRSENKAAIERTLTLFNAEQFKGGRAGAFDRIINNLMLSPWGVGLSRTGAAAYRFRDQVSQDAFFKDFFTDNLWATMLIDLGIPGTLLITGILGGIVIRSWQARRRMRDLDLRAMQAAILSALVSAMVGYWGAEGLLYNPEAAYFWFFAGVLFRLPDLDRDVSA